VLSELNIEAELSHAYLHAVATRAGFGCEIASRHLDGHGIDAVVREEGRRLAANSTYTSFSLEVQLKATTQAPVEQDERFSFRLKVHQYNRLRTREATAQRILVVLYLPATAADWLTHSEDGLLARRCAYWVSLRGAPESTNEDSHTVYVPRSQLLSPDGLLNIMRRCSLREEILYAV
jgi:hypothetical protein